MKKVCVLTTLYEADSGYSVTSVIETQIKVLLAHHYEPIVLVRENFKSGRSFWQPHNIDVRPVLPHNLDTERSRAILVGNLEDVNVCITHDIFLINDYANLGRAVMRYAETRQDLVWLHWLNSVPTGRHDTPPGYLIYPNSHDLGRVCSVYGLAGQEYRAKACRAAHAMDPLDVWQYSPLTRSLLSKFDLLAGEIAVVYPTRMNRSKQIDKAIRLLAGCQKAGYEVRLLVCDWQSGGREFQEYMNELADLAGSLGLAGKVAFTSRLDDSCNQGVPRQTVQELLDLSNVYIHPSSIETYSLNTHEAFLRGLLVIANFDFQPARELWGDKCIYFDFGSETVTRTYSPDEQTFWNDEAHRLITELRQNRALWARTQARREWTPEKMWKEFEALLWLKPA